MLAISIVAVAVCYQRGVLQEVQQQVIKGSCGLGDGSYLLLLDLVLLIQSMSVLDSCCHPSRHWHDHCQGLPEVLLVL